MVSKPERQVEPPAAEAEMRLSLENQSRVARALHEYADAMVVAFGKLSELQQALQVGGLEWVDDALPLSRALLAGFGEAHKIVKGVADDKRVSLETHRRTLAACETDLAASDAAAEELQRYSNKMDQLSTDEVRKGNNQRAVVKLTRNREKMRDAANVASVKHTRAFDSLQACASRADDLCLLACDVLAGTATALRSAAAHVGGQASSPSKAAAQLNEAPRGTSASVAGPTTSASKVAQQYGEAPLLAAVAEEDGAYSPFFKGGNASAAPIAGGAPAPGWQRHPHAGAWSSATTEYTGASEASAARTPDECGSLVSEAPPSPSAPWSRGTDLGAREALPAQGTPFAQLDTTGDGLVQRAEWHQGARTAPRRQAPRPPSHSAPAPPMPQKPELPGADNPFDFDAFEVEAKRAAYVPLF